MARSSRAAETVARLRDARHGPIATADAEALGITRGCLRAAVSTGELVAIRRGFVVPAEDWALADPSTRRHWALQVATTAWTGSFGSHDTAGLEWRLPDYRVDVGGDPPTTHITREGRARTDGWIRVHGCDTDLDATTVLDGVPVTSLARTAIDLCATRSPRTSVVFMDAAMRRAIELEVGERALRASVTDPRVRSRVAAQFDGAVAHYSRHRWVTHVRQAIRWADPAAETVLESVSRHAMIEAGLPLPRCGVPMVGDDGRTYWLDFYWDAFGLAGEADGLGKYADPTAVAAEKRREEALSGRVHGFVRWGMAEVVPSPAVMLERIRRAMVQPVLRDAWNRR